MTPERWRQVNELFHAALEQDEASRDAFLEHRTTGDPELQAEVRSLLHSHGRSEGYLDVPAWGVAAELLLEEEPAAAPKSIGKYRVLHELARGGMGVVYLARDEILDRTVAVKSLPPEYGADRVRRERLAREAKTAAQLSHRAIATVYELQEADGRLYIVTEYVPGATLRKELADGPLPPAHLLSTLVEIASALAAAHARNIIHRDLKPENIVRRDDGQIKILDFGLARTLNATDVATMTRQTEAGLVAGTPGYLAPELFTGRDTDARSDVFVFGLLAWELATGEHPFGSSRNSQLARLLDLSEGREVTLTGSLSVPGLDVIVRRCIRRRPEERYETAAELLDDLRALQAPERMGRVVPVSQSLWWWQVHQGIVSGLDTTTPVLAWMVREWSGRGVASWMFFAVLALATTAVTLRLHLLFTSRVHTAMLVAHRARLFPWIATAEGTLAAILLASAVIIGAEHEATTAVLISLVIIIIASLTVIEPATTRGAGLS